MILGPFTLAELGEVVGLTAPVAGAAVVSRPNASFADLRIGPVLLDQVVTELERRYYIPLAREARSCRRPDELVALVNTQVTSGV